MITLTLEGQIRQVGNTLRIDREVLQVETIQDAITTIEERLDRPIENWDSVTVIHDEVWAIV